MKIPTDKNRKLANVPKDRQVFIYDASIMIEFLHATFLNLYELCTEREYRKIGPGIPVEKGMLIDDSIVRTYTTRELYEMYLLYRTAKDYTADVESFFKFVLILKKMTLPKNGWQFNVTRFGRKQIVQVWPLALRMSTKPPVADPLRDVESENADTTIDVSVKDFDEPEEQLNEIFSGADTVPLGGIEDVDYPDPGQGWHEEYGELILPEEEPSRFERDFGAKTIAEAFPKFEVITTPLDQGVIPHGTEGLFDAMIEKADEFFNGLKEAVESPPQTNSSVPEEPVKPLPIIDPGLTDQY